MATEAARQYPLVSIGIPTYNRADSYLPRALESALAQSWPELEIIVSDNGSTDTTETVVKSYGDSRIRYFHQEPAVLPNDNFNFCLAQARGTYFLLLHDDDEVDPDFIEICLDSAGCRTDLGLIRTGIRLINANGNVIQEKPNEVGPSFAELFIGWFTSSTAIYLCNTLFNTQRLREAGGFRSRHNLFQDVVAIARVAAQAERVDIRQPKASARQHDHKWGGAAHIRAWCEDSMELLDVICELAPDRGTELRRKGLRFFAQSNYRRASRIGPLSDRLEAYGLVYRSFGRSHFPAVRTVFRDSTWYRGLRQVKRRILGLPAWID